MGRILVEDVRSGYGVSFRLTMDGRMAKFSIQGMRIISNDKFDALEFISALQDHQFEFIGKLSLPFHDALSLRDVAEITRQIQQALENE